MMRYGLKWRGAGNISTLYRVILVASEHIKVLLLGTEQLLEKQSIENLGI